MYTNIDTDHALDVIEKFLYENTGYISCEVPVAAVMAALAILVKNNYFKLGDTFFHQLTGTAMGAPPACVYANIY